MDWSSHHLQSEQFALLAEKEARNQRFKQAVEFYQRAAEQEEYALNCLDEGKVRTRGITAVSAVSLWLKGQELQKAQTLAHKYLESNLLPPFAISQLKEMLEMF